MPGEAVVSTPGTELEGRVVGDSSVVVPAQAGVLGTCNLARGRGTRVEACWFGGQARKTTGGLLVEPEKPSERMKVRGPSQ